MPSKIPNNESEIKSQTQIANINQPLRYGSKRNALTPRQREVLRLLADGMNNKQIANTLKLSVKTIDAHRASIMTRLQIFDLPGLVKYALKNNLTSLET